MTSAAVRSRVNSVRNWPRSRMSWRHAGRTRGFRRDAMPLVKTCPSCDGRIIGLGRERLRSAIRHPRRAKCPHCGAVLQGSLGYWLLAHMGGIVTGIGALGLLGLTVKLISPTHTVDFFVITAVGIGIMYFGLWRVRFEEAQSSVNR